MSELEYLERMQAIKHERRRIVREQRGEGLTLTEVFAQQDEEPECDACLICTL